MKNLKLGQQSLPFKTLKECYEVCDFNRDLNMGHVLQIKESLKEMYMEYGDFHMLPQLIINQQTGHLLDGNHRWEAFRLLYEENNGEVNNKTEIDVKVVSIPEEKEFQTFVKINCTQKGWSLNDFLDHYTKQGKNVVSYKTLKDFCASDTEGYLYKPKNKKCNYRYGAAILKGQGCQKMLRDGSFTVTEEELGRGYITLREVKKILKALKIKTGCQIEYIACKWIDKKNTYKGVNNFVELFLTEIKKTKYSNRRKSTAEDIENIINAVGNEAMKIANKAA